MVLGLLLLLGTAVATQWSVELLISAITATNVRRRQKSVKLVREVRKEGRTCVS